MNRDTDLNAEAVDLAPLFAAIGAPIPAAVRISCGWPGGGSRNSRIGECWSTQSSADGHFELFISPMISESVRVLDVLTHELVHAAVGLECGHKGRFGKVARALGLEGKLTATVAGAALRAKLEAVVAKLGGYPGAALNLGSRKKQSTRLVKCECDDCGYTVRTTSKWLDLYGAPLCPCNSEAMTVADAE